MKRIILLINLLLTNFLYTYSIPFSQLQIQHYTIENGVSSNGTDNGLNRFDGIQFKSYSIHLRNYQIKNINALCEITDQEIWIGTESGIFMYNTEKDRFSPFTKSTNDGVQITKWINHIITDKENNIWIATQKEGVFFYNRTTDKLEHYDVTQSNRSIIRLLNDYQNNIWATGLNNLYKLNLQTNLKYFRSMGRNKFIQWHYGKMQNITYGLAHGIKDYGNSILILELCKNS